MKNYVLGVFFMFLGLLQSHAQCPKGAQTFVSPNFTTPDGLTVGTRSELVNSMWPGEYVEVNLTAGNTYRFDGCENVGEDTYLTIRNPSDAVVAWNDNTCNNNPQINYTPTVSGKYSFSIHRNGCGTTINPAPPMFYIHATLVSVAGGGGATVSSIARASSSPSNSNVVNYTVTFSGNVTGVSASNFSLTTTGSITGASVGTPSGSGTTWTVPVNTGTGDGTIRLDMANATGVNPTVTVPYTSGEVYTIDKSPPTISISAPSATTATCGSVTYTISYTGASTITLAPANVTLNIAGTATATVAVAGSGTSTRTVTLSGISGTGTLGISIAPSTATDGGGNNATGAGPSTLFTVSSLTGSISANNSPVCANSTATFTLSGTSGATVTYKINGGSNQTTTLTGGTATVSIPSVTANQTLTLVSVSDGSCSQNLTGTSIVSVNNLPTASISANNSPVCANSTATFTLSGTSGATVTYKINGGSNQTTTLTGGTATVSVPSATANQNLTLVSVNDGSCSQNLTGTSTVTVNNLPTASISANNSPVCANSTATFTLSGTSGATVTYTLNGGSNQTATLTGGTATVSIPSTTANQTLTLVSVSDGSCSQNLTGTSTVTVNNLPTASISVNNSPICANSTATFTLSGTSGATVTYKINGGSNQTTTLTGGTATVSVPNATADQTLTLVSVSDGSCSQNLTGTSTVTVNNLPTASISVNNSPVCANSTATFTLSGTSGATVTYKINGGSNQTTVLTGGAAIVSVPNATANQTLTLVSVSDGSCSQNLMGTSIVIVNNLPTASISVNNSPVCANSTATFTLSGTSGATVTYTLNGGSNQTTTLTGGTATVSIPSVTANQTLTLVSVSDANGCSQPLAGMATVTIQTKPSISLQVQSQVLNEGNNQVFCDTDANPVNSLQFSILGSCVSVSPVWRVQVGSGAWSNWVPNPPISQSSNNQLHRYQAACDANCPATYSGVIEVTINYRASVPQHVSLTADGVGVAVGETKEVCAVSAISISFTATCGAGEIVVYSVDGGEYATGVPAGVADNLYHNYRVRCREANGIPSCVESESGVMRLKLVPIPAAPQVSLFPETSCNPTASFSGQSSCGSLKTVWHNATTNIALPNLPSTIPTETTSYYARCQTETGCLSEKSQVVTFTLQTTYQAPVVTVSQEIVCTGTTVVVSANCPAGSRTYWNTGITAASFEVAFSNVIKQTYWAKCLFDGGCQSQESSRTEVYWNAFVITLINIGESRSSVKINDRAAWSSQFITRDGGPTLEQSTQQNPTLFFVENPNKMAPRFWTINADACNLGTNGSLTFDMLATPEMGVVRSFNTHENNAPYFMYANREGWTELYAQNHPAYGFYADNGAGGNAYDSGLPKGLYKLSIRYWDQKGWGSIYPSTRQAQGNVLAYQEYWFRIQSKDGVGIGAARAESSGQGSDRRTVNGKEQMATTLSSRRDLKSTDNVFATVFPNPVTNALRLKMADNSGVLVQVCLRDATGRKVLNQRFIPETDAHIEEIQVSSLAIGVYVLEVRTGHSITYLKVIKTE